jgi:hypothetical protein
MILRQKKKWCQLCEEYWSSMGQLQQKSHLCNHTLEECKHNQSREIGEIVEPMRQKSKRTRNKTKLNERNSGPKSIVKACEVCGGMEQIKYYHITKPFFCRRKQKSGEACGHQRLVTIKLSKVQMTTLQDMTWTYNQYPNSIIQHFGESTELMTEVLDSDNYKVREVSKVLCEPRTKDCEPFKIKSYTFKSNSIKSTDLVSQSNLASTINKNIKLHESDVSTESFYGTVTHHIKNNQRQIRRWKIDVEGFGIIEITRKMKHKGVSLPIGVLVKLTRSGDGSWKEVSKISIKDLQSLETKTSEVKKENTGKIITPSGINHPSAQGKLIEDEIAVRTRNLDFRLKEVQAVLQHPFIDAPVYVKRDGTSENKTGIKVPIEMKTTTCLSELSFSFIDKSANQLAVQALELGVDYGYLIIVSRGAMFSNREFTILKLKGLTKFHRNHIAKLNQVESIQQFFQQQSEQKKGMVMA